MYYINEVSRVQLYFIISLNLGVFLFGFWVLFRMGFKRHWFFSSVWSLTFIYYFFTPSYFYWNDRQTIWGNADGFYGIGEVITDYYGCAFYYFATANIALLMGYLAFKPKEYKLKINPENYQKGPVVLLFFLFFSIVIFNFSLSDINLFNLILNKSDTSFYFAQGGSNFLRNLADSLVSCLLLAFLIKVNRPILVVMVVLALILFAFMGFRYRAIILFLGLFITYIYYNRLHVFSYFKIVLLSGGILYLVMFFTVNRMAFIYGQLQELKFNPVEYPVLEMFTEQTRGALADINIIDYYETRPEAKFDHGLTFFYFVIRAIPRELFGDFKDQFYPPPSFKEIEKAYNLPADWDPTGEAPLYYTYFIIAGGFWFLLFGMFFVGLGISWVCTTFFSDAADHFLFQLLVFLAFFQWFTRGYFPAFVDLLFYLLIPYFLYFKWYARRKSVVEIFEH